LYPLFIFNHNSKVYAQGLRNSLEKDKIPIMDHNTYSFIFDDLEIIKLVNKKLLETLDSPQEKKIGKIFFDFVRRNLN
jgi:hypothetical protein